MSRQESRLEAFFHRALDLEGDERSRFLDRLTRESGDVGARVRTMIESLERDPGFLQEPVACEFVNVETNEGGEPPLGDFGRYRLIRVLGAGGTGAVYEAEQERPRRRVALKVLRRGVEGAAARSRFEHEADVLACLDHPGIARVFEAGIENEKSGEIPFIAMELIAEAQRVTDYVRSRSLSRRERLNLFSDVCQAVQHAHEKGVLHRDLKPDNILVGHDGVAKVIDFGLARLDGRGSLDARTESGQILGTLQYMSPEQLDGEAHQADTRSDVYALGVVLYELLCEAPPWDVDSSSFVETVRTILTDSPIPPQKRVEDLETDLVWILKKAMAREREDRYHGAMDLAADIERHLDGDVITARPPSLFRQARSLARRRKALFFGVATVVIVFVVAFVAVSLMWMESARNLRLLEASRRAEQEQRQLTHEARIEVAGLRTQLEEIFGVGVDLDSGALTTGLVDSVRETLRGVESIARKNGLLESALGTLERLEKHWRDDVPLARSLAQSYKRIGEIQGADWMAPKEIVHSGEQAFRRGRSLLEYVWQAHPHHRLVRRELADLCSLHAQSLRKLERNVEAFSAAARAVELAERGYRDEPDAIEAGRCLVEALWARGDTSIPQRQLGPGLKDSERAVQLGKRLRAMAPEDADVLELEAWSHARVGIWLHRQYDRGEEALLHYRKAVDLRLEFCRTHPRNMTAIDNLLDYCGQEVQAIRELSGELPAAARLAEICSLAGESVLRAPIRLGPLRDLLSLETWRVYCCEQAGRPEDALERLFGLASALETHLEDAAVGEFCREELVDLLVLLSRLELECDLIDQAENSAREAITLSERRHPEALEKLALVFDKRQKNEDALAIVEEALACEEAPVGELRDRLEALRARLNSGR